MPSLSPLEIVVVGVVALIVFGPQRLPEIARTVGRWLNEMRRMANEVRAEFEEGLDMNVADEPDADEPVADKPETPEPAPALAPDPDPDDPDSGER
ncbi:MAG: hypothetical protein QOG54_595 [Actinomycetota bacterium]|jgi:Tat protein translocase TatB subunit|nr:hypothetical protein [Actinomycetota bacterium]